MTKKKEKERKEFLAHFPRSFSKEIKEYIDNSILPHSRYIFTRRVKGIQFAYCTHCHKNYKTNDDEKFQENARILCSKCNSKCTVKASGRSRKYLYDRGYVVYYEKSLVNPQAIIARGLNVSRDFRGNYIDVDTVIKANHLYLFVPGQHGVMYSFSSWHGGYYREDKAVGLFNGYGGGYSNGMPVGCNYEFVKRAVQGTPYQYSTWEKYQYEDMVKFFDLYSRYPCIEYLTKLGLDYFVKAKMFNLRTYSAINWNGTSIERVLKINKQELREIMNYFKSNELHPLVLRLKQIIKKDRSKLSLQQLNRIASSYADEFDILNRILKYTTLTRANNYIQKQYKLLKEELDYSEREIIITWRDYIQDCLELELDLSQDQILFPKDLHEKHIEVNAMIQIKTDQTTNLEMAKRAKQLANRYFEHNGLFIRPAKTSQELINEGKRLRHCVGQYMQRYIDGENELYFIRKTSQPKKPYYTVEVRRNQIIQCRGFENCSMTEEVEAFVEAFKKEKLTKKTNRQKPKEVAV